MSGFQTEMFVRELAPEFKCAVSLLGLKEPVQTPCGHRFCHQCIYAVQSGWLRRGLLNLVPRINKISVFPHTN